MTVEGVAHIRAVRYIFDNAVFLTELLNLQTTQAFSRGSVDCVQPTVLILELRNLLVDMLHNFQGKLSVLCNGLAVVEPLQLI